MATFGLTILGPTFKLPDWVLGISPLRHVPNVTAVSPDWSGLSTQGSSWSVSICIAGAV